ncbi:MAG: LysM peptidoglycan-binding domain-containing protein [Candidatus Pseudomonas phytovorans]|uniref:LysM peptidoglycan-binding domain-containing protein n=1 Tax=Candidatus Pseudomonas phytovorans TaxID=3121377 RepID=A0AAJ5WF63_9PSED|nr:FimV/HubP family polar landmark protein [Pseudomonas sp.]WEK29562.1 MAG: LysM peptidoglycan-binding domain-containing protein [Pseudomonas sp.]
MLRIRKLVLAMAAASALSSGMANALGLGELTLKSAQNQPLDAEIELLDVRDLKAAEVVPSLASPEEFSKAGVALPTYLEDLTFTPVINPNGKSVLRVTSSQPLPGSVVKFLVQVMWPQGRLLRDYSVLLDQAKAQGDKPAAGNVAPAVTGASNYTTQRRDTLWQIAAGNTQGGSIQQTMIAIQALNPDAFIGNNINQLKVGQVLRLPDQQQIQTIAQGEANSEVAEQYAAWREGRRLGPRARQLDATRRGAAEAAPARIAQGDNLRLVSPGNQAGAGQAKALNDKLAVAEESLDTSRRDNDELKSRMTDLQSQLDKLQRLIELKNDQLARLEGQGAAAPAVAAATPAQPAAAAQPAVKPAPAAADTAPKPVPAAKPAPVSQPHSALDQVLSNPWLLGLIAGSSILVLALLLWLLARKRKAQQEAEKHLRMARALEEEQGTGFDNDAESLDGVEVSEPSVTLSPAVVAASAAAAVAAEKIAEPEPEPQADPHGVLLAEVDQCLAEGRLNRAAELLEPAVAAAPERDDLRLKLMDVYARQGDQSAFVEHERQLPASEQNTAEVAGLKERYPAMLGLAAAGLGAAALAAEMDEQYVQELLHDEPEAPVVADVVPDEVPEFEPQVEAQPEVVAQAEPEIAFEPEAELDAFDEVPILDVAGLEDQGLGEQDLGEQDLDSAFDLSLGEDLPEEDPLAAPLFDEPAVAEPVPDELVIAEPVLDEPEQEDAQPEDEPFAVDAELQADADADFEAMLAQTEAQPAVDLSDFDLDVSEPVAPAAPDAVEEAPVDIAAELAAFDSVPEFDPVSDFDMPSDFDLSLSLEDDSPAAKRFASELDDVNAELDKLSQSLESPSLEPHFTSEDAAAQPEPEPLDDLDFDFFSGSDEVATKLDLARAYIDMGDNQGARDILDEVVKDGDDTQRQEAEDMLSRLV